MIRRIVLMKLNERADAAVIEVMQGHIAAIRDGVAEVRSYDLAPNRSAGGKGYNWAILASFDSEADMTRYKQHPLHQDFVASTDPYTEDFIAIDYELPGI